MSSYDILQNSFPSGEISPLWRGRSNTQFYQTGLALCRNFMPMTPSGLRRRPGTRFVKSTYNQGDAVIVSVADGLKNYEYEITHGYVRVWDIEDPDTIIAYASSAYLEYTDIHAVQIAVNKGVLWLANENYPVTRITLSSGTITVDRPTFTGDYTFSTSGMYPKAIGFTGTRLVLGFTKDMPNAIFMSCGPDYNLTPPYKYTDFTTGTDPMDALELEDSELIKGNWFLNQIRFLVGSERAIFMDDGAMITPADFDISPGLHEGSADIPAKGMRNYIVYAGVSGKTLSMMVYNRDAEGYQTRDLTTDSSHLFSPGIKDFAITFMPDLIIWVLLKDGTLLSCTIDSSTGTILTGWAKHPMTGRTIETITAGRKDNGCDILILTASVEVGGVKKYHIETLELDDIFEGSGYLYLDSAVEYSGTATDTINFGTIYAGLTVSAISDNCVLPNEVVADDGTVTLDREVTHVIVGIPYESLAGFLSQEQPTNGQSSFGNIRRLKKTTLRVYQSFGGYIGIQHEDMSRMYKLLSARYAEHEYGEPFSLVDEDFVTDIQSQNMTEASLYVLTDYPTPLNILALKEKIELLET